MTYWSTSFFGSPLNALWCFVFFNFIKNYLKIKRNSKKNISLLNYKNFVANRTAHRLDFTFLRGKNVKSRRFARPPKSAKGGQKMLFFTTPDTQYG